MERRGIGIIRFSLRCQTASLPWLRFLHSRDGIRQFGQGIHRRHDTQTTCRQLLLPTTTLTLAKVMGPTIPLGPLQATAAAWHEDELTLNLEVTAPSALGQVGNAMPEQPRFGAISENVRRARAKEFKRVMATADRPITLLDASGRESPELRRFYPPQSRDSVPTGQSFAVVFEAPSADARHVTLVVPFVELMDRDASASVDLRALPTGFAIGGKQFTALSAEPRGSEMKVIVEVPRGSGPRYVVQPAGILGSGGSYSWGRGPGDQVWFAAKVGDPPIVRFIGVVERVEGPWRMRIPLR